MVKFCYDDFCDLLMRGRHVCAKFRSSIIRSSMFVWRIPSATSSLSAFSPGVGRVSERKEGGIKAGGF